MNFYTFRQNNSGGRFIVTDDVAHVVIVEANNADEANQIALEAGIYFNGCQKEIDCDCCGDRWNPIMESDDYCVFPEPMLWHIPIQWYQPLYGGDERAIIYHKDGRKEVVDCKVLHTEAERKEYEKKIGEIYRKRGVK